VSGIEAPEGEDYDGRAAGKIAYSLVPSLPMLQPVCFKAESARLREKRTKEPRVPKEKARRRIAAAGLQAPATSRSHWVTPQTSSYSVFVPFQLDQSTTVRKSLLPALYRRTQTLREHHQIACKALGFRCASEYERQWIPLTTTTVLRRKVWIRLWMGLNKQGNFLL
jgi:hypothetical protein